MRPEIICSVQYCTGIKCLSCKVMMMCWKYGASINLTCVLAEGMGGRFAQVAYQGALNTDIPNVTW